GGGPWPPAPRPAKLRVVINTLASANEADITLAPAKQPLIAAIGPTTLRPGVLLTIQGSRFGASFARQPVTFDSVSMEDRVPLAWSDTQISVRVPPTLGGAPWPAVPRSAKLRVVVNQVASANEADVIIGA